MEWDFLETSECTDFSSKLNHPLPLQLQCPYFPLLLDAMILICQNGEFRKPEGGYHMQWVIIVTMSKSLKLPQLALWIFNLLQWDHCIAFHCNCIQSQNVCGLCLEYSDFSLGCLPLVEYCLSLEYWGLWLLPCSPSGLNHQNCATGNQKAHCHFGLTAMSWLKSKFLHAGAGHWVKMCSQWNHFQETLECYQLSQAAH